MKAHTTDFKNTIKQFGRELDSKITFTIDEEEIVLGTEVINSVTPHYESSLLKSVMKQLDIDSNVVIPVGTIINYQFGVKVGNSFEYLDFGNYVVYKVEKQEDTRSWKITCYDKMLYAMKNYESLGVTYPITIKNYLQALCTKIGLTLASNDFVNQNKEIQSELYLDSDGNSLDYTYRDVLDEIAQVTASVICINNDDELEIRYPQNVGEYETQEGTSFTIENVDDSSDLAFDLNGNTIQNGTPTPTSPIAVENVTGRQSINVLGKNVFDYTVSTFSTPSRVNMQFEDNVLTMTTTGTYTSNDLFFRTKIPDEYLEDGASYTLSSVNVSGVAQSLKLQLRNKDTSSAGKTASDTVVFDDTYSLFIVGNIFATSSSTSIPSGTTAIIKNIQVEKGTQLTTYEEYKSNTYEINLGKNLCDYQALNLITNSNGTTTIVNGYYNVIIDTLGVSSLYVSGDFTLLNSNTLRVGGYSVYPSTSATGTRYNITSNSAFNTNNHRYIMFCFLAKEGYTIDEIKNSFQIEKGTSPSDFSPYKEPIELCKIGNYKDFIRKGTGKNLFDMSSLTFKNGYYDASGNYASTTTNGLFEFVEVEPNTTYTLSVNTSLNVIAISEFDSTQTFIKRNQVNYTKTNTFTSDENTKYLAIAFNYNNGQTMTKQVIESYTPQLELGGTPTIFEPYGYKDKWYLYKAIGKVVLNGTESINYRSDGRFDIEIPSSSGNYAILGICDDYLYTNNWNTHTNTNGTFTIQNINWGANKCIMSFKNTNYSSLSDVRAGISSNNIKVYYQITNNIGVPTATEITDTELINQLESVRLLQGLNNVVITSDNLSTPIKMTYLKYFDTIDEEYLKDVNVNFGEKYGPVNSVVLSRSAESDNIYQNDEESIEENGLTEIKIKDNQILNGNNRDEFLQGIFNQLNGIEYYINDYTSTGIAYYDLVDMYGVKVEDNLYKCLMLNDELDVTQGLQETIHTERMEDSETDYTKADKTDRKINQAYIIVDKQNQQINSVVQTVNTMQNTINNQGEQIDALGTRITQSVDNITASVTSIQEELDNGVNLVKTTSVIVDDNGLTVATDTSKTTTTMTSEKFTINSGGKELAFFGYDDENNSTKAQMDNLTVTNYFVAGYHRTEKYDINGEHRTGVFYIGE